jgi:DNA-binding transcriptional regulator GbsR (MarR family)
MNCCDAKKKFITTWGQLGVNWGICRTMAQMHALLLISARPLCTDDIMSELELSRGNVNMNINALLEWGLVYKAPKMNGERKEYFQAEKDFSIILKQIIKQRKKKELEPLLALADECHELKPDCADSQEFRKVVEDIKMFSRKADNTLEQLLRLENQWLTGTLLRMIR